jgi:uncharacterized protein YegL
MADEVKPGERLGAGDRVPLMLLLDRSSSVDGKPIETLNAALTRWIAELREHELASRLDLAMISFGDDRATLHNLTGHSTEPAGDQAFVPVARAVAPTLTAGGNTPLGQAIRKALAVLPAYKRYVRQDIHVNYYRPIMWILTDGKPNDKWEAAAAELRQAEQGKHVLVFAVGFGAVDKGVLDRLAPDAFYMIDGLHLEAMLRLVSSSAESLAHGAKPEDIKKQVTQDMADIDAWLHQTEVTR